MHKVISFSNKPGATLSSLPLDREYKSQECELKWKKKFHEMKTWKKSKKTGKIQSNENNWARLHQWLVSGHR